MGGVFFQYVSMWGLCLWAIASPLDSTLAKWVKTPGERDQCRSFHTGRKRKQLSMVHETLCAGMIFHFWEPGSTHNRLKQKKKKKKDDPGVSDAVKHPSVRHRMSLWKQQEVPSDIGKARRRRRCIKLPAEQCSVLFIVIKECAFVAETWLKGCSSVPLAAFGCGQRFNSAQFTLFPCHT